MILFITTAVKTSNPTNNTFLVGFEVLTAVVMKNSSVLVFPSFLFLPESPICATTHPTSVFLIQQETQ
jgi:hypothetical protein